MVGLSDRPPNWPLNRRLNDLVGSDIGLHVGKNFLDSFPERWVGFCGCDVM